MKTCKSRRKSGYNDANNRFVYKSGRKPELYDEKSELKGGVRIDVTQVRPNI
jgi:hypothetical protein